MLDINTILSTFFLLVCLFGGIESVITRVIRLKRLNGKDPGD